ncbi:hypothetical protein ACH5RR_036695 [Cinchona calisaya]|uniref:Uncharacterized protein n=1 Tax=Cinchona calisaya TaxID=153742 RepID=A0ABD2Y5D3_9GENT
MVKMFDNMPYNETIEKLEVKEYKIVGFIGDTLEDKGCLRGKNRLHETIRKLSGLEVEVPHGSVKLSQRSSDIFEIGNYIGEEDFLVKERTNELLFEKKLDFALILSIRKLKQEDKGDFLLEVEKVGRRNKVKEIKSDNEFLDNMAKSKDVATQTSSVTAFLSIGSYSSAYSKTYSDVFGIGPFATRTVKNFATIFASISMEDISSNTTKVINFVAVGSISRTF